MKTKEGNKQYAFKALKIYALLVFATFLSFHLWDTILSQKPFSVLQKRAE